MLDITVMRLRSGGELPDGLASEAEGTGDLPQTDALGVQPTHRVPTGHPPRTSGGVALRGLAERSRRV